MDTSSTSSAGKNNPASITTESTEANIVMILLKRVVKKWWLFLLVGMIAGIGGIYYASTQKVMYESYLTFALDEGGSEGGVSGAAGLAAQFGISLGGAKDVFTGDNIMEIMMSRRVIEKVFLSTDSSGKQPITFIEKYLQHIKEKPENKAVSDIHFLPGEDKKTFSYAKDSILYVTFLSFKNNYISIRRPNKKLNIYELSVTTADEKFSKLFTDKLIHETNHFYTDITSKKARETMQILESRLPDMKGKLDATLSNKASIEDANVNPAFAAAQVPLLKEQVNTQVYGTAYGEMFKNLEVARFQYLKSIPLMQIIDEADYPMKKIKVSKLKTGIIFSVAAAFIFLLFFLAFHIFRRSR